MPRRLGGTEDMYEQGINEITEKIIGCAIEVHRNLGAMPYWNPFIKKLFVVS